MYGHRGGGNHRGGGGNQHRGGGDRGSRQSKKAGRRSKRSQQQEPCDPFERGVYDDYDDFQALGLASRVIGGGGGGWDNKRGGRKGKKKNRRRGGGGHDNSDNEACEQVCQRQNRDRSAVSDDVFAAWEALLASREDLRRRLDSIAAVHGWEGLAAAAARGDDGTGISFLGGIEPESLLRTAREEVEALGPASAELERADLALKLGEAREREESLAEERDRLADEMARLREECFEAQEELVGHREELDELRRRAAEQDAAGEQARAADRSARPSLAISSVDSQASDALEGLGIFNAVLGRDQLSEGDRVVDALTRLKLPDEASMGPHELASWQENKKTITNSLRTISGQIYSATTRILYEIIQNADDCSFEKDGEGAAHRELYLECSDDALVAFHNECGFQPKDLYAMCQVGESSKVPGSGKIGRKGIGFKSVFQICDRPLVISPPFLFCFDTRLHGIFGYIIPMRVDVSELEHHVPLQHRDLLRRIYPCFESNVGISEVSKTGTLLVCPKSSRIRGLDLMRDHDFDGLSLAFLKNLEKITFVSSTTHQSKKRNLSEVQDGVCAESVVHEYRMERTSVLEQEHNFGAVASSVLKGITIASHQLFQCTIVERISSGENRNREIRRYYRVHNYTILKYKSESSPSATEGAKMTTMAITLAFPVNADLSPQRSADGELVFAYLPVTAAGFGFAINADFELVASRQDVNDNYGGNHVILGRIPPLFVHAVLTDPALGEEAFSTFLPDVDVVRKEARSGGGRKWHTLALALHRETAAWMTIPTEDEPEKVKRRNVVLRPLHLSRALVSNSLLRAVTGGDMNFAHPDAVKDMGLDSFLTECPIAIVLDCIRVVLERAAKGGSKDRTLGYDEASVTNVRVNAGGVTKRNEAKRWAKKKVEECDERMPSSIADDALLDVWRYFTVEYVSLVSQGGSGQDSLSLLVEALIGGVQSIGALPPLRIFPVLGSTSLRLHCEHGAPLCLGLSSSLTEQGAFVTRLAEQVIPRLDFERLKGVDGINDIMRFLRLRDATLDDLEQQLKNCFRFGLVTSADPQCWWDSFEYAVSVGHAHGLVDFMPNMAIALPLENSCVVSSRDVQRLSVSLPCLLGLCQRPSGSSKYVLAIPPSVNSWRTRVRWELAMVQAFGATYPRVDAEHLSFEVVSTDLLDAITNSRSQGDCASLKALGNLLDIYESRMGTLVPMLRAALEISHLPEECIFETRTKFQAFPLSCSPLYIDEIMEFTNVGLSHPLYHDARDLLGESLGMLQLRSTGPQPFGDDPNTRKIPFEEPTDVYIVSRDREYHLGSVAEGSHVTLAEDVDASDEATWSVMVRLLQFRHSFNPSDSAWLLYSALTRVFLKDIDNDSSKAVQRTYEGRVNVKKNSSNDSSKEQKSGPNSTILHLKPLFHKLAQASFFGNSKDISQVLWPLICDVGGLWLGSDFVSLKRCIWDTEGGDIWGALQLMGCEEGTVVAVKPALLDLLEGQVPFSSDLMDALRQCCIKGLVRHHNRVLDAPPLPFPSDLEMMVGSVLPWLLGRDCVEQEGSQRGFSEETLSCYSAVVTAIRGGLPSNRRWKVPVLSATMCRLDVSVDRRSNRQGSMEFVTLPDPAHWPVATAFCLRHFSSICLHPTLAPIFAPIADRQSVGLDSPRAQIQQSFKHCLRLAYTDANSESSSPNGGAGAKYGGIDDMWALVSEVYERSSPLPSSPRNDSIPHVFSDQDNWELLLWAAITCATQWHRMMETSTAEDAARYQETLSLVRRLVPFVKTTAGGGEARWSFLTAQHPVASGTSVGDAVVTAVNSDPVLILRTLFGFDLWDNIGGIELLGQSPYYTAGIPAVFFSGSSAPEESDSGLEQHCFPEDFDRWSLLLIWEWFLLEVVGAEPPSLLWAMAQVPIVAWVRPRIRDAEASIREFHDTHQVENFASESTGDSPNSLTKALLKSVSEKTQIALLLDQMDAIDEARREVAAREAEARRRERQALQERRRLDAENRRRERQLEREQRLQHEREQRQEQMQSQRERREQHIPENPPRSGRNFGFMSLLSPFGNRSAANNDENNDSVPTDVAVAAREAEARRRERQALHERHRLHAENRRIEGQLEHQQPLQHEIEHQQDPVRMLEETTTAEDDQPAWHTAEDAVSFDMPFEFSSLVPLRIGARLAAAASAGHDPVRRHVAAPTMRQSIVKGKLMRFLAGMRAYERQQAADGIIRHSVLSEVQRMPPILSDFVAWAGDFLADEVDGNGREDDVSRGDSGRTEESARSYLNRVGASGRHSAAGTIPLEEENDQCCICLMKLRDNTVYSEVGEPIETACGHCFHAVCFARHLEASENDVWCPLCRSGDISARFVGG